MIQPEPEDLPKDNPKLEIAVLRRSVPNNSAWVGEDSKKHSQATRVFQWSEKKVGFSTKSLLEQWKDSYENGDYDEDPYDDDMYKGQS
ncbi:hypothetical protein Tco_0060028 [Tanacetum coccineum]